MSSIQDSKNYILNGIHKGTFPIGSVMPPANKLAAQLKCSPGTIHSALKELSREGIVSRVRKLGTTVMRKHYLCRVCLLLSLDAHSNMILYRAVHDRLVAAGYDVDVVLNSDPAMTLAQCERLLANSIPPDYLVALAPQDNDETFKQIASRFRHCVLFTLGGPEPFAPSHLVTPDQQHSARLVAQHLISHGHRKVLVTAGGNPNEQSWAAESAHFCRHLLEMADAEYIPFYVFAEKRETLLARIRDGVTAFWALHDYHAVQIVNYLSAMNIRVPDQLSIVGRHDTPWSTQSVPALTSVSLNAPAAALAIAQIIEELSTGKRTSAASRTLVPSELVVRNSTGPRTPG